MFSFESKKIRTLAVIYLFVISLFLLIFVGSYYISTIKILTADAEENMKLVVETNFLSVATKIEEPLKDLSMISEVVANMKSPEEIIGFIEKSNKINLFETIIWIEPDFSYYTSADKKVEVKKIPYLKKGFEGHSYITHVSKSPITDEEGILYVVPVIAEGTVKAVIAGCCNPVAFGDYIFLDVFKDRGNNYLLNGKGDVISFTSNFEGFNKAVNLFDYLEKEIKFLTKDNIRDIYGIFQNRQDGTFLYKNGRNPVLMHYTPLDVEDWFLFSSMSFDIIMTHYARHSLIFILICISIIIVFGFIIISTVNKSSQYRSSLEKALYIDPVTGGMSYARFEKLAREIIHKSEPNAYTFISLDVHSFKLINDINGGGGGNATLMYIYSVLKKYINKNELMCRVDADIFNLLVTTKPVAEMERILAEFTDDLNSFNINKRNKYYLRIKAGFYTIPNGMISFMAIRDRANIARKIAKTQQTSKLFTYDVFDEQVLLRQTKEREFENMMGQSLQNNEFKVYLQPKINIQTGDVAGAEALVRWESSVYGTIKPDSFVSIFERNGFIVQIDLNIFEQVCRFLRKRIDANLKPVPISVNLSRLHLFNENFIDDFIAIRKQYDIPASLLEFEITESMAFEQLESMKTFINKIHEAGFTCSIDDFGSGYSSLNALGDIPADVLKLDKAFFSDTANQKNRNKKIVSSIISLAKKLEMKVVAEGIETTEQANFLQEIECDIIQGYIYSKPLPVAAFEKFLESWDENNRST